MPPVARWGLLTSALAPTLLIGGWSLAAALRPGDFDAAVETISALAAEDAPRRWVMTTALLGVGACHLGTAIALRPAATAGRAVLGAGGVATAAVALTPLPAGGGGSGPHAVSAGVAFLALAAWPAVAWRREVPPRDAGPVARNGSEGTRAPAALRPAVALGAAGGLLGLVGWFAAELVTDGGRVGSAERVAAAAQALWPLVAVLSSLAPERRRTSPRPR